VQASAFNLCNRVLRKRYDDLFEAAPNAFIQQSSDWAEVIGALGPDEGIFLLCHDAGRDVAGLPLYLYEHPLGNLLTSVPQPGPMGGVFFKDGLSPKHTDAVYRTLIGAALEIARRRRCIAMTLISNPLTDDLVFYKRHLSPTYVLENYSQVILLDKKESRSHGHRNNVNKVRKAGYRMRFCETAQELESWFSLHEERHRALGIEPLNPQIFKNFFEVLQPRQKARLMLIYAGNRIVSGAWYIYHRNIMDVFMLSADAGSCKTSPNFMNTDLSIAWAKDRGVKIYNWQSSPGRDSGVYSYKKQWGSLEKAYYFVTKLLCKPERIARLGLQTIKDAYAQHYLVPYAVFDQGFHNKYFKKG